MTSHYAATKRFLRENLIKVDLNAVNITCEIYLSLRFTNNNQYLPRNPDSHDSP